MRRNYNAPTLAWQRNRNQYRSRKPTTPYAKMYVNGTLIGYVKNLSYITDPFSPICASAVVERDGLVHEMDILPREIHGTIKNLRIRGDILQNVISMRDELTPDDFTPGKARPFISGRRSA